MGRLSIAVVVMVAAGACHDEPPRIIDGFDPDASEGCGPETCSLDYWACSDGGVAWHLSSCNPLSGPGSQGCNPGQRCVWYLLCETADGEHLGTLGCVPDATAGLGEACTPPTVETPDDCASGLVCVDGTCHDVCGFDGSANAACAPGYNCTHHDGLFSNGDDDPLAGACDPGCDPVTQLRIIDGQPCGAGMGCYVVSSQTETVAVCANAGEIGHGEAITGPAFANSCVPGAQPRRRDGMSNTFECGGLCAPADVTSTMNMASEAGVAPLGCERWGAAPPSDPTAGESCRYWWAREPFFGLSPYSNSVGWCFKHAAFQYDSNGDLTPDAPFPRCTTLTTGDVVPPIVNPPHNDAEYFWCTALPATFTGGPAPRSLAPSAPPEPPPMHIDRLRR